MATSKDVAKLANVSTATVSHVINGTRYVSEEVKNRVKAAMEELDYIPNLAASALKTKKTKTVGLLIPINADESSNIFFMQIALGIDEVLKKRGYFTFLSNTHDSVEQEINEFQNMKNRQIDGLIIAPNPVDSSPLGEVIDGIDTVFIDRIPAGLENQDCVISDAVTGSKEAVLDMISNGHRQIGLISGIVGNQSTADSRYKGYREALKEAGISYQKEWVQFGNSTVADGYKITKTLMENHKVTAIFVTSNIMGVGAVQYFNEHKIRIGKDIEITLFDDYEWIKSVPGTMKVIRQEACEMGKKAAEILVRRMNEKQKTKKKKIHKLPLHLIEKE